MLCDAILIGSRLLRAAQLLLKTEFVGKTLLNRIRVLDTQFVEPSRIVEWLLEEAKKRDIDVTLEQCQRLVELACRGKPRRRYAKLRKNDIAIVLAYFSLCEFKTPLNNAVRVVTQLAAANYPVVLVEVLLPNAAALPNFPDCVQHKRIIGSKNNMMFLKENLWNIGCNLTDYAKLVFMDTDVEFTDSNWLNKTSDKLATYDIVQPYETAIWRDKHNAAELHSKKCVAYSIAHQLQPNSRLFHPGFSWAARRDFLTGIGGWYDEHVLGAGDTSFWAALDNRVIIAGAIDPEMPCNNLYSTTTSFTQYRARVLKQKPKIGYLEGNSALHLWHGRYENRRYSLRNSLMPATIDNNYPLVRDENGLWSWINDKDRQRCLAYFCSRKEDEQ
jgi:hypothetical protein